MDRPEVELLSKNVQSNLQSRECIDRLLVGQARTRAFRLSDECFKDFLLPQNLDSRSSRESETAVDDDLDWHAEVTLEVGPQPNLSETQAKVIALDYGWRGGKANIQVRRARLYHALGRLGLDTDLDARKPQEQQIVLINREIVLGENLVGHVL